jgi:hypothetical protein
MAGKDDSLLGSSKPHRPDKLLDLATSVAGEEDPGASMDMAQNRGTEGRNDQPAGRPPTGGRPDLAPGDEAAPGTPSTGESICPQCGGSGRLGASSCPNCLGTGKVIVGIGGA